MTKRIVGGRGWATPLGRTSAALALLLYATACRAPHEINLFGDKPAPAPPMPEAPCPPDPKGVECVECNTDAECSAPKPACSDGRCVECTLDPHCPPDQACNASVTKCTKRCADDTECDKDTKFCNVTAQYCVGCLTDSDCTKPDRPRCETQSGTCVACTADSDCAGATPYCSPEYSCVECVADLQCPDAGTCDVAHAKCATPKP